MEAKIIIQPASIKVLVEMPWKFSYNVLWRKCILNERETEFIKELIYDYYWSIPPSEFVQKAQLYFDRFCAWVAYEKQKAQPEFRKILESQPVARSKYCLQLAVNVDGYC